MAFNLAALVIDACFVPSAVFNYSLFSNCTTGSNPTRTLGAGASDGVYSATPAGLTLNAGTGAITLSSSSGGTYVITNTIAAAGGCAA